MDIPFPVSNLKLYHSSTIQEFITYLDSRIEHFGKLYEQYNNPEFLEEMKDAQSKLTIIYREYPMERFFDEDEE